MIRTIPRKQQEPQSPINREKQKAEPAPTLKYKEPQRAIYRQIADNTKKCNI